MSQNRCNKILHYKSFKSKLQIQIKRYLIVKFMQFSKTVINSFQFKQIVILSYKSVFLSKTVYLSQGYRRNNEIFCNESHQKQGTKNLQP